MRTSTLTEFAQQVPPFTFFVLSVVLFSPKSISAGEITSRVDEATGWPVYTLVQGETTVRVVPDAGANAFSLVHEGVEYFRVPKELKRLPGVGFGNPILYPMPNRVRGASFTFEGKVFEFPKNGRGHFIHGLVHSESFSVDSRVEEKDFTSITCSLRFAPGRRAFQYFPIAHVFRVTISVRDDCVRWTYEIDNSEGKSNLPFGVGFHPYVIYQASREQTFLRVPATHWMESNQQLPSGDLRTLDGHPLDARKFRSLEGFNADDVFFGMTPDQPARIEFRDVGRSITFRASKDFTHLVVWTPNRPYFGIENQTCSTDAHNLTSEGKGDAAHLQICPPGEKLTGFVEYQF